MTAQDSCRRIRLVPSGSLMTYIYLTFQTAFVKLR
ncbi:hypothetical protein HNQ08_000950 [Deinococcus humi]|uniref:Uncharacterized protein n=1 Tax=Deinococcus humi TaxID=662880 RepID=A0A7W8JRG3_9DEIO|nr:hypothetical protein [Deinococcus humi]